MNISENICIYKFGGGYLSLVTNIEMHIFVNFCAFRSLSVQFIPRNQDSGKGGAIIGT